MATTYPEIRIGVLGLQGDVSEHIDVVNETLKQMSVPGEAIIIKKASQIDEIHGLIMPGGESTTVGRIARQEHIIDKVVEAARSGMPILGTCAGAILLAKEVYDSKIGDTGQPVLGLMDIRVARNAFGRQKDSFEADITIPILGDQVFRGVFIRAPIIERVWAHAQILAKYKEKTVAVQQGNLFATSFHPELSGETRFHQHFLRVVLKSPVIS